MTDKNATGLPIFAMGFLSIGFQIYLLREFLILFNGIELVIGVALAFWILFTGFGAFLTRYIHSLSGKYHFLTTMLLVLGTMPALILLAINHLKFLLVPDGSIPDFTVILFILFVAQFPFCFINGLLFTLLSARGSREGLSRSYATESLGSAAAGALVNFVLLWLVDSAWGVWLLSMIYLLIIVIYFLLSKNNGAAVIVVSVLLISLLSLVCFFLPGKLEREKYPGQKLIVKTDTPYGRVVVTGSAGQLNYYANGMLLFSSGNEIYNEEGVHYAMVQHPHPRKVLLISGGFTGMISEILKYRPDRIDYVEQDPALIGIASRFTRQLNDPAVIVHSTDPRRFVRQTNLKFDVVLINLPPPASLQVNRFYSREFIRMLKDRLVPGAVVAWNLPVSGEYLDTVERTNISILWRTLMSEFARQLIVPGNRNYFLASDSALDLNIPELILKRNVRTIYVNQYYLDYRRMKEKSADMTPAISNSANPDGLINQDFHPRMVWNLTTWWFDFFKLDHRLVIAFIALAIILLVFTLKPISSGLFTGGFTLASAEIMLIFGIQVLFGNIFFACGLIIMLFMIGMAMGSTIKCSPFLHSSTGFSRVQMVMAFLSGFLTICLHLMGLFPIADVLTVVLIVILAISISFVAGLEYQSASAIASGNCVKIVASNYSADLFGASAGALVVSVFLIPLAGILFTGVLLVILNLASSFYSRINISS